MVNSTPKYALIGGKEVTLREVICHALSNDSAYVFKDSKGTLQYVSESEWRAGARAFAQFANSQHIVTSESVTRDKIALFRSFFKGREDVYAHGFLKKQGGIGYSPACYNERTNRCPRWTRTSPGMKCANCPLRNFIPMNDRAIVEHFKGERDNLNDVMGLYVLTPDLKTWVLVADFDKDGWQRETILYRDACRHFGLFPTVERSRSGNGAHVWLFFDEPVDAELARNLGFTLITHAMSQAPGISFKSYDRLFPTQSTIAQGGFGNLISMPLQGRAQKQGNSVFVDDDFVPFPDQWRFLSSVPKTTIQQVRNILDSATDGPLGQLAFASPSPRRANTTYERPPLALAHQEREPSPGGFSKSLLVIKANMLFIDKQALSHQAQNKVRRLAAFGNPEFFKAQAMHRSVHGIPRIIWCGDEDERFIMLPRGCEQKLMSLLAENGCSCSFEDKRNCNLRITAEFVGTLRERQQKAADALLRHENGILMAPTGFGKTIIGAYIIGALKARALIIVPKANLIAQWKERLEQFLSIVDNRSPLLTKSGKPSKRKRPVVGQIGGGKNTPSGIVDVATFQSLSTKDDLGIPRMKPIVNDYELIICDECHYGAAPHLELVMKSANARRVYGLSATPKRSDGLEGIIYMHCGPIRHKVDPKEQAAEQGFKRILKPRFTRIRIASLESGSSYNQVVDALCGHEARNNLIVEDAANAVRANRTPLVITKRKEHAANLAERLERIGVKTYVLTGEGTSREKRQRIQEVRSEQGGKYAIVATGSYIGEGFDLPQLDTLLLASPYSWEGVITQYSGRLHRESSGKTEAIVYDYVDTSLPMLERMYKRRLKTYAKLGYKIEEATTQQELGAHIVARDSWQATFISDIEHASKTIMMSVSYANPKLFETLLPYIADAVDRGVKVHIVFRRAKSEKSIALQDSIAATLEGAGCLVAMDAKPPTGIATFDGRVSWYGTLPLLAFPKDDDCSLRVDGAEVASDLEKALAGFIQPQPATETRLKLYGNPDRPRNRQ